MHRLSNNSIGNSGVEDLQKGLKSCRNLQMLE